MSNDGSTQVGNRTFTIQMAEIIDFLPIFIYAYTQDKYTGWPLILLEDVILGSLSKIYVIQDTPDPVRQSLQTHIYVRVNHEHNKPLLSELQSPP